MQDLVDKLQNMPTNDAESFYKNYNIALVCEDRKLARLEDENI
jgi:hypothetical protein